MCFLLLNNGNSVKKATSSVSLIFLALAHLNPIHKIGSNLLQVEKCKLKSLWKLQTLCFVAFRRFVDYQNPLKESYCFRLYGCYESLGQGGSTTRALQDLTGGIVQSFGLSNQDRFLTFQVLNSAVPRSSLLIASINPVSFSVLKVSKPYPLSVLAYSFILIYLALYTCGKNTQLYLISW